MAAATSFAPPGEQGSADVGWLLVLIRLAVLLLLVELVTEIWRWGHGSIQEHGVGAIAREGVVRLVGLFDRSLTWRRLGVALAAMTVTVIALIGLIAVLTGL